MAESRLFAPAGRPARSAGTAGNPGAAGSIAGGSTSAQHPGGAPGAGNAAAGGPQPHPYFVLLDRFRDFYAALTEQRRQVVTGNAAASAAAPPAGTPATGGAPAGPWQVLLALLQAQAQAASRAAAAPSYAEAQYLMAVFADEVFLDLVWPGRAAWAADPLEHELFGTDDGRTAVFERLDALLARGVGSDLDLARTYLLALALGFRGRYRGAEERSHLDAYRARLVEALYQHDLEPRSAPALLFPDTYLATRSEGRQSKLPAVRFWTGLALSALVLYAIFSYRVWDRAVAPLEAVVERVLASP